MEKNLTPEERETLINWADDENRIFIYTTQKKMMNKLRKNPLFEMTREIENKNYKKNPIGIEGYLPRKAITIRKALYNAKNRKFNEKSMRNLKNVGDL